MDCLRPTADGVLLQLRVLPRASKSSIEGEQDGVLRVRLTAPPVEGAANKALIDLLSGVLGLPKRDVMIVRGERSREKTVLIRTKTLDTIISRLRADQG